MVPGDSVAEYWEERSRLGEIAGTQDLILKELEQREILSAIPRDKPLRILEVGCGRGETARLVSAAIPDARIDAIDSSEGMIREAARDEPESIFFQVGDVLNPPMDHYNVAYSQRCLINLPSWDAQKQAIEAIGDRLVSGGRFLMCEHAQSGLDFINGARDTCGLPKIERPWHNQYIPILQHEETQISGLTLKEYWHFSALYYFLSRVVNAKIAQDEGRQPEYDSPINRLALTLPWWAADARFAQGCLWIWEKA